MYFSSRNNFTQTKAHYKTNTIVVQGLNIHNYLFDIFAYLRWRGPRHPKVRSLLCAEPVEA